MGIFKGQGKSGVTGPTVQATVGKNKKNHAKNEGMTAQNIVENGRIKDGDTQMGASTPYYNPTNVSLP